MSKIKEFLNDPDPFWLLFGLTIFGHFAYDDLVVPAVYMTGMLVLLGVRRMFRQYALMAIKAAQEAMER